jgi:DNA repair exonuclease SbcCD ATPase subunit
MIKLLKLKFQNVGRFVEMQSIDFTNKSKLLQFDAKNENTGGSSGSGKSTVFQCIDLLLGINGASAATLQSRLTKSGFFIEGEFLINDIPVTISRSKKDGLIVRTPTETVEGNAKIAEEKIDSLLGIPRKLFGKMVHKKQKEGGFFLELTAKESYDFMVDCLGLQEWESKLDKINAFSKEKELTLIQLQNQIKNNEELLGKYESDLSSITKPAEIDQNDLDTKLDIALRALDQAKSNIDTFKNQLAQELQNIELEKNSKIPPKPEMAVDKELDVLKQELNSIASKELEERSALNSAPIEEKIKNAQIALTNISKKEVELENKVNKVKELKKQKEHIVAATCPTCSQKWVGESAVKKVEQLSTEIANLTAEIVQFKDIISKKDIITKALDGLRLEKENNDKMLSEIAVKYAEIKAAINNKISNLKNLESQALIEWNSKRLEVINKYDNLAREKERHFQNLIGVNQETQRMCENDINNIRSLKDNYQKQLSAYNQMTSAIGVRISELKEKIAQDRASEAIIQKNLLVAAESHRAVKNYTLQIFQDTLNFIGEYATQILNAVPAMSNATLYFENCKETKTGKIKDEINCIINLDGENNINIKTLSGGERTAVDLAVDLAVIEVLESQAGKGADWIVLDEPFTGLDSVGCEAAIDIIKQIGLKKRIIIVDHNPEVKEVIEESIMVHRRGSESNIVGG